MMIDFLLEITQDIYSIIANNILLSLIAITIHIVGFFRFYAGVTVGVYKDDQDMSGKTVLITGASDGNGKMTAYDLARRNARILLACRNLEKANKVSEEIKLATGNPNIIVKSLDLSSFESVRNCAQNVLDTEDRLDVLINNAGATDLPRTITEDGCELLMQTNYFGHFLLTLLLLGVTVNALHPGLVKSAFFRNSKSLLSKILGLSSTIFGKTPEEGAYTTIRLAVDPSLEKTTGKYFKDCKTARTSSKANDKVLSKRLFELSEQIVGKNIINVKS